MAISTGNVRFCAAMAGALVASIAGAAGAQSVETVDVVVSAEIPARCGFGEATGTYQPAVDLEAAHVGSMRLNLTCNAPYAVTAVATNGKLVRQDGDDDGSGFAFSKIYGVAMTLYTDKGPVVGERCSSDRLVGVTSDCALSSPAGLRSGAGVSINREAVLTIDWPDQRSLGRRLAAGRYSDTLTFEIGARP